MVLYWIVPALISFVFCGIYSISRKGIFDTPNERSLHEQITKKGGGVFVMATSFLCFSLFSIEVPKPLYAVFLFLGIGLWDDWKNVSFSLRLFLETILIGILIVWMQPNLSILGFSPNPWILIPITVVTIVFLINLVNFMDGMDTYSGFHFFYFALAIPCFSSESFFFGEKDFPLLMIFLSSVSGFLFWNFPKAKLFLGDSGSLSIGFLFAILPLLAPKFDLCFYFYLFPVYLVDGFWTIVLRLVQKKNIFEAHREHLYQKAFQLWKKPTLISLVAISLNGIVFFFGYFSPVFTSYPINCLFLALGFSVLYFCLFLVFRYLEKRRA